VGIRSSETLNWQHVLYGRVFGRTDRHVRIWECRWDLGKRRKRRWQQQASVLTGMRTNTRVVPTEAPNRTSVHLPIYTFIRDWHRHTVATHKGWTFRVRTPLGTSDSLFTKTSRLALCPTQPVVQWVPELFPGDKAAGAWRWPPSPIYHRGIDCVRP